MTENTAPETLLMWKQRIGPPQMGIGRNITLHTSPGFGRVEANRAGDTAKGMRNYLRDYFISPIGEEQAPWQYIRAFRGDIINLPE